MCVDIVSSAALVVRQESDGQQNPFGLTGSRPGSERPKTSCVETHTHELQTHWITTQPGSSSKAGTPRRTWKSVQMISDGRCHLVLTLINA